MASISKYEFGGTAGAAAITFGLPVLLWFMFFTCNDVSGCPAPGLLAPESFSWKALSRQLPWPQVGVAGVVSWKACWCVLAYYMLSAVLYRVLPAKEVYGSKLNETGRPLLYRLNAFYSSIVQLAACGIGTYIHGANFVVWTTIEENYLQLLTVHILLSYVISVCLNVKSFTIKAGNAELRELAPGGQTGNLLYDYFIGRELNPRITLPCIGEIDLKAWLGMRPGLTGWILLDLAFIAKQYRNYGYISDSIVFVTAIQAYYVLEGQYAEMGLLNMKDIISEGLGFMLTFGNMAWVPFLYSTQCRYLSVHPVPLGSFGFMSMAAIFALGVYVFRASNNEKALFRKTPNHPSVAGMSYIQTKRGTRLLTAGWWGMARHINYFGDWLQALPFCIPTGTAGYIILPAGSVAAGTKVYKMLDGREVVQGEARGWGMAYTYLYAIYFAVLLVYRERRDDALCADKYGENWDEYKKIVKWRILPGIY